MFEQAARMKLRFATSQGSLSVEDLFDLPLKSARGLDLDDIAITLSSQVKNNTESFVDDDQNPDPRLQLAFDIVKHVIAVKKAENKAAAEAHEKAAMKQKLRGALARKRDEAIENMSEEDIEAALAAL